MWNKNLTKETKYIICLLKISYIGVIIFCNRTIFEGSIGKNIINTTYNINYFLYWNIDGGKVELRYFPMSGKNYGNATFPNKNRL